MREDKNRSSMLRLRKTTNLIYHLINLLSSRGFFESVMHDLEDAGGSSADDASRDQETREFKDKRYNISLVLSPTTNVLYINILCHIENGCLYLHLIRHVLCPICGPSSTDIPCLV
jgi:hypothetical protein